jgi:glycosyltransferase involved in cell wall biosynthesis
VRSVDQQTLKPAEIILIDDGSDDETRATLRDIQKSHENSWIKIYGLARNQGPATARNLAWDRANQPYIAFLDADDSWHPRKIEFQYRWMADHPEAILTGHQKMVVRQVPACHLDPLELKLERITATRMLLGNCFATSTVMCRREIEFRFTQGKRYSEDYLLWLSISLAGCKMYRFNFPFAYYHKALFGEGGLSAHLWAMEAGQLDTYRRIHLEKKIGSLCWVLVSGLSLLKFGRRLLIKQVRKKVKKTG